MGLHCSQRSRSTLHRSPEFNFVFGAQSLFSKLGAEFAKKLDSWQLRGAEPTSRRLRINHDLAENSFCASG
jgi:hypothetical protein